MEIISLLWPFRRVDPLSLWGWSGMFSAVFSTIAVQCPYEPCSTFCDPSQHSFMYLCGVKLTRVMFTAWTF